MFGTVQSDDRTHGASKGFAFRKLWFLFTTAALVVVALYTAWIFWSRHAENLALEQRLMEKQRVENARAVEMLGGNRFEIQGFYATPGIIARGETAELCYGVSNAKSVSISPEVGRTWPSASRCIDISPKRDTTYTLTAEDAAGNKQTATLMLQVR